MEAVKSIVKFILLCVILFNIYLLIHSCSGVFANWSVNLSQQH